MSSNINATNIDATYPVAGQDNDSQGFRDNFSVIKTNFTAAKSEIEELQTKVLLKAPLGTTGTVTNDLGGSNISNGSFTNFHGTSVAQAVSGTASIDVTKGSLQAFTLDSNTTFTFTNWPASGSYANVRVHFLSNGASVNVGNDVTVGKRYTINQVGTTNFVSMGADPTTSFSGSINGSTLTVDSVSKGTLTVGTYIYGTNVAAGTYITQTKTQNPVLTGQGGSGTYTVSTNQTVTTTAMTGIVTGVVFVATAQGSGTGSVKPWREVNLLTEGTGELIPDSEFSLPLLLNPNQTHQVVEAWTWTGSTSKKVYVNYIGNLDSSTSNYASLNIGQLNVSDTEQSTSASSGALVVTGGAGVGKNLNVGGDVTVTGNLIVTGNTTLTTSSVTIQDIGTIQNVNITSPVNGDSLKYNGSTNKWTNQADLVEYTVSVSDFGNLTQQVFYINGSPLAYSDGTQFKLRFQVGKKYRFKQEAGGNNTAYPLRFSTTPDTITTLNNSAGGTVTDYTEGVTYGKDSNGVVIPAGQPGAYSEILVTDSTPSPLYLYALMTDGPLTPGGSGVYQNNGSTGQGGTETDKVGAQYPVQVGRGPVKIFDDYTPVGSQDILADTTAKAIKITLPLAPTVGTTINIYDAGNAGTNNITIDAGAGIKINNVIQNIKIAGNYGAVVLVCDGTNWTAVRTSFNGSDDVAPSTAVSLDTAVSYFSTTGIESSTLAAGVEGQVKTLVMKSASGKMTVSVSNAGWKSAGAGDIEFRANGDACTLQYIQDKWYVIGITGAAIDGNIPAVFVDAPTLSTDPGLPGQVAFDGTYMYVCVADNSWRRTAISTW